MSFDLVSPGFRDNVAYWIGASDSQTEGDFRWSSGYPFSFASTPHKILLNHHKSKT